MQAHSDIARTSQRSLLAKRAQRCEAIAGNVSVIVSRLPPSSLVPTANTTRDAVDSLPGPTT